jgi:hypothetical protein
MDTRELMERAARAFDAARALTSETGCLLDESRRLRRQARSLQEEVRRIARKPLPLGAETDRAQARRAAPDDAPPARATNTGFASRP